MYQFYKPVSSLSFRDFSLKTDSFRFTSFPSTSCLNVVSDIFCHVQVTFLVKKLLRPYQCHYTFYSHVPASEVSAAGGKRARTGRGYSDLVSCKSTESEITPSLGDLVYILYKSNYLTIQEVILCL